LKVLEDRTVSHITVQAITSSILWEILTLPYQNGRKKHHLMLLISYILT